MGSLSQFQQLNHLALAEIRTPSELQAPAPAAFAALTASSRLQCLNLKHVLVPKDAWQFVFAPGRCLPEFTQLRMEATPSDIREATLTDTSLAQLAAACPNLAQFSSKGCLAGRLTALQPLSALTKLSVDPADGGRVPDIAGLTGLRDLWIRTWGSNLAETSIMQLSAAAAYTVPFGLLTSCLQFAKTLPLPAVEQGKH